MTSTSYAPQKSTIGTGCNNGHGNCATRPEMEISTLPDFEINSAPAADADIALIVDDESAVRGVAAALLESLGFRTVEAFDGHEARRIVESAAEPFGFALVDLTMPGMDGEQTLSVLQAGQPGLPVFLMSGYDENELHDRYAGRGFAGFLQKPFRIAELGAKIQRAVEERMNS